MGSDGFCDLPRQLYRDDRAHGIGGFGVMRGWSAHSKAAMIDHGITLFVGIVVLVSVIVRGGRK